MKTEDSATIISKLEGESIVVKMITDTALALPNGTKLETILNEGSYQVQDLSSQHTGEYFKPNKWDKWWDCCAASGGKTLLLHSLEPIIELLVSDLRESVLLNLDERFRLAGIRKYHKRKSICCRTTIRFCTIINLMALSWMHLVLVQEPGEERLKCLLFRRT